MRLLVVAAGSTGGYFGARLAQAGRDVTFLVRPGRAEKLRQTGLQIVSPHGNVTISPQLVTADALNAPFDAVLLTVKGFQVDAALDDLRPAIGPDTMILPVLNGMRHMDILARRFSPGNLVGGALKVVTMLDPDGRIVQLAPIQDLAYGELGSEITPRIEALHQFMQGAGFSARLSDNIQREMWEKWILLASLGATTCLMRGTIGEIEAAPGGTAFTLGVLAEATAVVRAAGTPPSDALLAEARERLTTKGSPLTSSMYRDLQQGSAIEVENIVGDLVRLGQKAGLAIPLLSTAYVNLAVYQNKVPRT